MRKYIYIGCGSFLGAILRYLIERIQIYNYHENVPLNTLIINISGAFLLALILTTALEVWAFDPDIRLGIVTGFLGAYTTFSTLCKETVGLLHSGDYFSAVSYLTVSTMLGLGASYFGIVVAREIGAKLFRNKEKFDNIIEDESDVDQLNLVLVGLGGILGGLCRFQLGKFLSQKLNTSFPLGTFMINITGALLLGLLTSIEAGNRIYLLLGDGFLATYTTFSTFMYEGFNLFQDHEKLNAFLYILGTIFLGIIGYVAGYAIGKSLILF